jgi:phosphoglycerol transferase MdoB-like AlkP superfamily enzyme
MGLRLTLEDFKIISKRYMVRISCSLVSAAIFIGFMLEFFQRSGNLHNTIWWILYNPKNFMLSTLFVISMQLLILAMTGRLRMSLVISIFVFAAMGFSNTQKISKLGEPLYPVDFYHILYIRSLFNVVKGEITIQILGLLIPICILSVFLIRKIPRARISGIARVVLLPLAIFIIYSFMHYDKNIIKVFAERARIDVCLWNQPYNYDINGFVFGMLSNLQNNVMEKPEEYSEEHIHAIMIKYKEIADKLNTDRKKLDYVKPNILFILNETFWDPTRLKSLTFSEDPMVNIREIMSEHSSGMLLSPAFGGQTANVEFETLTGMSMYNLISGAIPYQQVLDKKRFVPSIVSTFNEQGYQTVAIHPYNKVFYKRDKVFSVIGFEKFISETEMIHTETYGSPYISDQAVVDEMLALLQEAESPVFIHAVTMQNHLPVNEGKFGTNSVSISGLGDQYIKEFETFTEGIKWTDKAVKNLVDRLFELKEPTIVVFYGDHLPALNNSIFEEGGLVGEDALEDERVLSETPLFIFSNYGLKKQDLKVLSPAFLGVTLLDMMEHPLTPYQALQYHIRELLPGLKSTVLVDSTGKTRQELNYYEEQLIKEYKLIQYDLLIGDQYSLKFRDGSEKFPGELEQ